MDVLKNHTFWLLSSIGIFGTPIYFGFAMLFSANGHSPNIAAIFYPYNVLLGLVIPRGADTLGLIIAASQCAVYGIALGIAHTKDRFLSAVMVIVLIHSLTATIAAFVA